MKNDNNLVWETVSFKEPKLTIMSNGSIYLSRALRDILLESNGIGIDFFKADIDGKTVLSLKNGTQFRFYEMKTDLFISCKELVDYIQFVYSGKTHFKLVLTDGYYILQAD